MDVRPYVYVIIFLVILVVTLFYFALWLYDCLNEANIEKKALKAQIAALQQHSDANREVIVYSD